MRDIKIQLYKEDGKGIEGYLTLTETSDFPITKALADIKDISKRKSTASKSIKIGGTKENNRLLEYLYDVDTVSLTYDIDRIQKCSVIIDGDVFLTNCILQVTDITKVQHNSAYECNIEYTVNIKSNNADFFSIIKNKELSDLTFGPNEIPGNKFIFKSENIINSFSHTYTDGYKYVLPVYTNNNPHEIPIKTFRPAIYLRTYFDKIIKEANFRYTFDEIQGSDNILHFNKLLVPFLNKLGEKNKGVELFNVRATESDSFSVSRPNNTPSSPILTGQTPTQTLYYNNVIQDNSGSWDGTEYVSQFTGNLNIKASALLRASIKNNGGIDAILDTNFISPTPVGTIIGKLNLYYVINKNGTDISNTSTYIGSVLIKAGTVILSGSTNAIGGISGEVNTTIPVIANDVIKIRVYGEMHPVQVTVGPNTFNQVVTASLSTPSSSASNIQYIIDISDNSMEIKSDIEATSQNFGNIIDLNNFIPTKVKQSDFIKSILNIFQLYVIPDANDDNLLHFITRDKFFDTGASYDFTNYLVKDKEQILNKLSQSQSKKKIFTYKEDKNPYNVSYTAETNEIYGQATFTFNDENIYDEDKVELIFSSSPYVYMLEDNMYLTDMPEESGLRLLYDGGVRSCVTNLLEDYTSGGIKYGNYINQYPLTIHFNDERNPTFDLNFSVCPMYFSKPDVLTNKNLFNNYWRRTIHQLNEGYMLTAYFNLSENIVSSLKMNEKIYLENKWYNINQIIDYNPAKSNIVKVELIAIDDGASAYKGIVIDNTKPGKGIPGKDIGVVDVFFDNNTVVANPGRPNTGTGTGNVIVGFDNNVKGNDNIIVADGAIVKGNKNEVKSSGIISGNNNVIEEGLNNVIVMGDNMTITESNTLAVENIEIDNINGIPINIAIPQSFIDLDDTPAGYNGSAGYKIVVNSSEDGLEFIPDSSASLTGSTSINIVSDSIQRAALTGDVTAPENSNTTTIANNAVTNTKAADMPANTIKGNNTATTSDPKDLTVTEVKAMLATNPPVDITQADLQTACNNATVVPGTLYRLTDQENIIFEGVTTTTVKSLYVIIRAVKNDHYTLQTSGNVKGVYTPNYSYSAGNIVIWGGRCWIKGTGTQTSTVMPTDRLDINIGGTPTITNWAMIATSDDTYYQDMLIKVDADIQRSMSYGAFSDGKNIYGIIFQSNLKLILQSDWGNVSIYGNKCQYIINNSNRNSSGESYNIRNNSNNGNIWKNSNNGDIYDNSNNGDIWKNSNTGGIGNNSNTDNINNNSNTGGIANNSNNGNIWSNSNNGYINNNSNNGYIISNSNNGNIWNNSNTGFINSNSNNGYIIFNSNTGGITNNSNYGNINHNSNNGYIAYNYQHTTYPTAPSNIEYNSNLGEIGGVDTAGGNRIRGHIMNNNNNGKIAGNTNNGLYTYNFNGSTISAQIGNNSNNGAIMSNTNNGGIALNSNNGEIFYNSNNGAISNNTSAGRINNNSNNGYINNNKNNGSIFSNANRGYIADNGNNGAINDNTSTNPIGAGNNIYNNINQGYVNYNNFTGNGFGIAFNINNGNIGGTSTINRTSAIVDTVVNK